MEISEIFFKTIFSKAKRRGKLKRKRDITIKKVQQLHFCFTSLCCKIVSFQQLHFCFTNLCYKIVSLWKLERKLETTSSHFSELSSGSEFKI